MTTLRDVTEFRSEDELRKRTGDLATDIERLALLMWAREDLGDACRVYPGLLRCTSRQLQIVSVGISLPIDAAASACRLTFEANIRIRRAIADPKYLEDLKAEFVLDEISLLEGFIQLADDGQSTASAKILNERIAEIKQIARRRNILGKKSEPVSESARKVGLSKEYVGMYRMYSKYVHASAWSCFATEGRRDCIEYRNIFAVHTQLYALDSVARVKEKFFT